MRDTLLDFLNDPSRIEGLAGITPGDRDALGQQLVAYRTALRQRLPAGTSRRRLEALRARDRATAGVALATVVRISEDKDAADFLSATEKREQMRQALRHQPDYSSLVDVVLAFEDRHQPARGRRLVRGIAASRNNVADRIRGDARWLWREQVHQAALDQRIRAEVLGTSARVTPPSTAAVRIARRWALQWSRLPVHRVRRCAWADCQMPAGRLFLASTSERDCPTCRRRFSRDTRSRVRRGVTNTPRRR